MSDKKERYTIYGSIPGAASESFPESPAGGPQQPALVHRLDDMKVEIERFLHGLDIAYPIRSKNEFLDMVKKDMPGICELGNRQISLRDLISITRDDDFPLKSVHEAAELLAGTCPIRAPNIT
jgi:hypothetical protein